MRWVLAALVLGGGLGLGLAVFGWTDSIAVPAALVFVGLICACMILALAGGDTETEPPPDRRSGRPTPRH